MSGGSLFRILILEINGRVLLSSWYFKSETYFWFTRPIFLL